MKNFIVAFLKNEEGLTMVEYAIAGGLVAAALAAAFTNLGGAILAQITALTGFVNA
jgi:pilus assembly protein Flp/PilA